MDLSLSGGGGLQNPENPPWLRPCSSVIIYGAACHTCRDGHRIFLSVRKNLFESKKRSKTGMFSKRIYVHCFFPPTLGGRLGLGGGGGVDSRFPPTLPVAIPDSTFWYNYAICWLPSVNICTKVLCCYCCCCCCCCCLLQN